MIPQFATGVDESIIYSSDPATQHILQSDNTPRRYIDKIQTFPKEFTDIPQVLLSLHKIQASGPAGYGFSVLPVDITTTGFKIRYTALQSTAVSTLFVQYLALVDDFVEIGYLTIDQPVLKTTTFKYTFRSPNIAKQSLTLFCVGYNYVKSTGSNALLYFGYNYDQITFFSTYLTITIGQITDKYDLEYLVLAIALIKGSNNHIFGFKIEGDRYDYKNKEILSQEYIIGTGFIYVGIAAMNTYGDMKYQSSYVTSKTSTVTSLQVKCNKIPDSYTLGQDCVSYIYQPCAYYCQQCLTTDISQCDLCRIDSYRINPPSCDSCLSQYFSASNSWSCAPCTNYCDECAGNALNCISCLKETLRINPPNCDKCPNGTYLITGVKNCQQCPGVCGSCLNETGICTSCNSLRAGLPDCSICPEGYYNLPGNAICQKCPSYCLGGCNYQNKIVSCTACQPLTLRINSPICQTCPIQYYLQDGQDNCLACPSYCDECTTQTDCISCNISTHRINRPLCIQCEHQYYYDKIQSNCFKCPSTCNGCTSANDCIACTGTRLAPPSCQACPSQTFKTQTDCQTCPSICDGCTDANTCISCLSNTNRFNPPLCQSCPPKYYADPNEIDCQKCDPICSFCNVRRTNCLQCQDDTRKPPQCKECNDGYYLYYSQCLKCDSQCVTCSKKKQCLTCPINKYIQDGECVSICQSGYYLSKTTCFKCSEQISQQNTLDCIVCSPGCKNCDEQVCLTCHANYTLKSGVCIEDVSQLNTNQTFEVHKTAILYIYLLQSVAFIFITVKAYYMDKISNIVSSPTRPLVTQVLPLKQINEEAPESGKLNNENNNDHSPLQSPQQPNLVRHQSRETSIMKLKSPQGENLTMFPSALRINSTENFTIQNINKTEQSPQKPLSNQKPITGLINKLNSSQVSPMKAYMIYLFEFHQITNIFKHTNPDCSRISRAMILYTSLMGTMAFIYKLDYGSVVQQVLIIFAVAPLNKIYQVILQNISQKIQYFILLSIAVLGNYGFFDNLVQGTTSNGNFKTIYYLCAILFDNFVYQPIHLAIGFMIIRNIESINLQRFLNSSSKAFLYGA